jgi:ATP/maltotriose-dependent transcriptional regulator MalT
MYPLIHRYHELFGDVLRLTLDPAEQSELHSRAARWYCDQGLAEPAIRHAMAHARATGSYAQAEAWIGGAAMTTLAQGALATVGGWLDSVPESHVQSNPELALAKGWMLAFVDRVMEYAFGTARDRPAASQPLVEPLSERELHVLALMAAGYSNAEIAERLVVAVGTVKRHINNMYGKLDVQSCTQAIAKARSLHLLESAPAGGQSSG